MRRAALIRLILDDGEGRLGRVQCMRPKSELEGWWMREGVLSLPHWAEIGQCDRHL